MVVTRTLNLFYVPYCWEKDLTARNDPLVDSYLNSNRISLLSTATVLI